MRKRFLLLIFVALPVVAVAAGLVDSYIIGSKYEKIKVGLTEAQVESLLGRGFERISLGNAGTKEWTSLFGYITLYFNEEGIVVDKKLTSWASELTGNPVLRRGG